MLESKRKYDIKCDLDTQVYKKTFCCAPRTAPDSHSSMFVRILNLGSHLR